MIEIKCKTCGKTFFIYPSRIGKRRHCSLECKRNDKVLVNKKSCSHCGQVRGKNHFRERTDTRDGLASWCKICESQLNREIKARNKEKTRVNSKKYKRYRRKNDPSFVLNESIGNAIRKALKSNKSGRHWEKLVGYSLNDLISRLKKTVPKGYRFTDILTGNLEVDHIIPKSVFNYENSNHIDFKRCWALDNLQLLPKKENRLKWNNIGKSFQPSLLLGGNDNA